MKNIFILFLFILLIACRPYKVSPLVKEIPLSDYSNINKASNKLHNFNGLPARIRNIPQFKDQEVTADSSAFIASKGAKSLFLDGAYDKGEKVGYVIQRIITPTNKTFTQCTLFRVKEDTLTFNFYTVPTNTHNWEDAKPNLHWSKEKLFNGGTAVFKTKKHKTG